MLSLILHFCKIWTRFLKDIHQKWKYRSEQKQDFEDFLIRQEITMLWSDHDKLGQLSVLILKSGKIVFLLRKAAQKILFLVLLFKLKCRQNLKMLNSMKILLIWTQCRVYSNMERKTEPLGCHVPIVLRQKWKSQSLRIMSDKFQIFSAWLE